jgi:hypothetical protein
VLWVEHENPAQLSYIHDKSEIQNTDFDLVLIAFVQPKLIDKAVMYLTGIRVPNEKTVIGGPAR